MVEYTRLLGGDWFDRMMRDWQRTDTVVLAVALAILFVVGYVISRKS